MDRKHLVAELQARIKELEGQLHKHQHECKHQNKNVKMMRTHNQKWLIENALFGCCVDVCREEQSFHYGELAIAPDGNIICECCWEEKTAGKDEAPRWSELRKFNPFGNEMEAFDSAFSAGFSLGKSFDTKDNRDEKFEQNGI
jgi:hypothetical protein